MKAELLDKKLPACQLGEGPHWDAENGNLSWVDIKGHHIHIYNLEAKEHRKISVSQQIGFAIPKGSHYVAGLKDGLYEISEDGNETLLATLPARGNIRFNDGKYDVQGRLWAGTMNLDDEPKETGALYCFYEGILTEVETGFAIPNGKDWNPDQSIMYHADTTRHIVWQYDYNVQQATISNKKVFIQFEDHLSPDGLCTDNKGNLYIAFFGAGEVRVFNDRGIEQERVKMPVANVTSCTLGGKNMSTLFVTTAYDGLDEAALQNAPDSGQVFKISLDLF